MAPVKKKKKLKKKKKGPKKKKEYNPLIYNIPDYEDPEIVTPKVIFLLIIGRFENIIV